MSIHQITDYGAVEGTTVTDAFQAAVDACTRESGGTVHVPPGTYEIGTVELADDITVLLAPGAVVYPSLDKTDYDCLPKYVGPDGERPLFVARNCENVMIAGNGTIDGQGTDIMVMDEPIRGHSGQSASFPLVSDAEPRPRQGEAFLDPTDGTEDWPVAKPSFRPGPMLLFDECTSVMVRDITLRNMPAWTLTVRECNRVVITGVNIDNHMLIPNCDGLSLEESQNIRISNCSIRCCDDAITLLSRNKDAVCENITVTNCTLASHACAIKVGSETVGPIQNCMFRNCVIHASNRGLGIQHRDKGDVMNISFSEIMIETHLPRGPWWGKAEPIYVTSIPRDDETNLGMVRNIQFSNIIARCENGVLVYGHKDATVEDIRLDGVHLNVRNAPTADAVGGNFDFQPTSVCPPIIAHDVPAVHCENVTRLKLIDIIVKWDDDLPAYYTHSIGCFGVKGIIVDGFHGGPAHPDASNAAISIQDSTSITIRNSQAHPKTGIFLSAVNTADERLFAVNDLVDAEQGMAGETNFTVVGNAGWQ